MGKSKCWCIEHCANIVTLSNIHCWCIKLMYASLNMLMYWTLCNYVCGTNNHVTFEIWKKKCQAIKLESPKGKGLVDAWTQRPKEQEIPHGKVSWYEKKKVKKCNLAWQGLYVYDKCVCVSECQCVCILCVCILCKVRVVVVGLGKSSSSMRRKHRNWPFCGASPCCRWVSYSNARANGRWEFSWTSLPSPLAWCLFTIPCTKKQIPYSQTFEL
jgi:hypothetical protein